MLKLYKRVGGILSYYEAWLQDGALYEHWGVAGERGELKEIRIGQVADEESLLQEHLLPAIKDGFHPIALDDHALLVVEYLIEGMGRLEDLEKRHSLEERLNEALGWTGLGHCDGGSIGSGTMEAACFVVDFDLAQRVIAADLRNTPYADYARIYQE